MRKQNLTQTHKLVIFCHLTPVIWTQVQKGKSKRQLHLHQEMPNQMQGLDIPAELGQTEGMICGPNDDARSVGGRPNNSQDLQIINLSDHNLTDVEINILTCQNWTNLLL